MKADQLTITFRRLHQIKQEYGSTGPYMLADVNFSVDYGSRHVDQVTATIKQIAGETVNDPIEVSTPRGWKGPWNHEQFQGKAEAYYRSLIGPGGAGINIGPSAQYVRMADNVFNSTQVTTIEIAPGSNRGGW